MVKSTVGPPVYKSMNTIVLSRNVSKQQILTTFMKTRDIGLPSENNNGRLEIITSCLFFSSMLVSILKLLYKHHYLNLQSKHNLNSLFLCWIHFVFPKKFHFSFPKQKLNMPHGTTKETLLN